MTPDLVDGLRLAALDDINALREVSALFARVWGRTEEGVPFPSEALRSLVHADGLVSAAYAQTGRLVGAAVLGRAAPGAAYGYVAAAAPDLADRGIGFALKQHQRTWALAHGVATISWTFDPLVARNARFNLTKLGAVVDHYEPEFYGRMSDLINGDDPADRVVARWELASCRAVAASEGRPADPGEPDLPALEVLAAGPDGGPALVAGDDVRWCRVPPDMVALRRTDPTAAAAWREALGRWLPAAFAEAFVADGVSRTGWYHLDRGGA